MASNWYTLMLAVQDIIKALALEDIPEDEVRVRKLPHDGEVYYRGITIHPVEERSIHGTNEREDVGYGIAVTMVQNNDDDMVRNLDRMLTWREAIRKKFVEDRDLGGLTQHFTIKVEFGRVFDDRDILKRSFDISVLVLRCWAREVRT